MLVKDHPPAIMDSRAATAQITTLNWWSRGESNPSHGACKAPSPALGTCDPMKLCLVCLTEVSPKDIRNPRQPQAANPVLLTGDILKPSVFG